ncbi:MAG TPA: AMP-binding protein [Candidatus Saccharimonadales bacterium]|nr:AMP-binding protein [Candidatus Saccharimonadales bacterium]
MKTLNEIVDASAARFGRKPALIIRPGFRTRTWTYRDLAELVPRVARTLADAGVMRGDRIVIWGVNRPEYGIAFLAALRIGAVLVPLDVNSLTEFARKIVQQTRATAAIVSAQTRERALALGVPLHDMEALPDRSRGNAPLPAADLEGDDLAEIVFTSGTTGDPKGAMLSHRNILSNAEAARQIFPIGPKQRLLSFIPLSHMFEQLAGFWTLLLTGASVIYPTSRQPAVIRRTFKERRVSMILITPAAVRSILLGIQRQAEQQGKAELLAKLGRIARHLPMGLRRLLFTSVHRQFGGRFRYIVSGGAALDPALGEAWRDLGVDVLQGYGTTECSPAVAFNRLDKNRLGSVGVPVPGVDVRIASDGEVVVRGPNVFKGYWENEEATRAVLDAEGWYHTGDLGEIDADGFLWLRGRKKDMIVLADGLKVYPEDIEETLASDPRVRAASSPLRPEIATVVGLEPPGEPVHVHAVFLLKDTDAVASIVRDANTRLSGSQQIRGWTVWPDEEFPTTPTQKVKKRIVVERLLELARGERAAEVVAAGGPERQLTEVERLVAQVANVPPAVVRPETQLSADLGMDSLARVDLLGVIEEELGAYIDDAAVMPSATVGDLERMVHEARDAKRDTGIFAWPLNPLVRTFGLLLQEAIVWPLVTIFYRVRVRGREHLHEIDRPVFFAPNHCLHWDNGIILTAIPVGWRWKLAIAAAADDVFGNKLNGFASAVLADAFPMAREGAIRHSLELLGARLDRNFSVLIYPEGKLTVGGPMQPFKAGTGLIAVEGRTPVVPMKLKIKTMSVIDRVGWPLRGDVEVVFGAPLVFDAGTDTTAATRRIEAAVAEL